MFASLKPIDELVCDKSMGSENWRRRSAARREETMAKPGCWPIYRPARISTPCLNQRTISLVAFRSSKGLRASTTKLAS